MNHRTVETTHPASESGSALVHVAIPHAQLSARKDTGLEGSAADSLLAAILVYYKDVMGNNLSPIYPPPFLQELRAFGRAQPPQEADLLSLDVNGSLERITKSTDTWNDTRNDLSIVDKIFYTIVSLRWAELTLAESIELQENSFEDMEFRSLVQRAARKCGLVQPALAFEELKSKVYLYLDDVIRDPLRYSQPEQISAYMPTMQWKNTLDHDLVFYLYLTNHKYQMLLFLEALRVLSIEYAIFSPSSLQKAILDEKDFNDQAIGMLYSSYQRVASRLDICLNMPASQHVGEHLDIVLEIVWEDLQPGSSIQTCLSDALVKLTKPSAVDVDQMLDLIRQMLHTSNVIPFEVIPSTLWIAAVCLHALDSWQEDTGAFSSKLQQ
ncbi:hypothetical protein EDD11_007065 [Mortierella claussenii]|nr:hypothetical protein EDD11_007065 [Mortierella claussenii]